MTELQKPDEQHPAASGTYLAPVSSSRRALMLGAAGAATVLSVRPALAQTVASVKACQIPIPDPANAGKYIDPAGNLVAPLTPGAFPASAVPLKGEDVKNALGGISLPGTSYGQSQAYMAYVRKLQAGQSGFTCFASLQHP